MGAYITSVNTENVTKVGVGQIDLWRIPSGEYE